MWHIHLPTVEPGETQGNFYWNVASETDSPEDVNNLLNAMVARPPNAK